jgi:hypothetical protein
MNAEEDGGTASPERAAEAPPPEAQKVAQTQPEEPAFPPNMLLTEALNAELCKGGEIVTNDAQQPGPSDESCENP